MWRMKSRKGKEEEKKKQPETGYFNENPYTRTGPSLHQ
jgi:hypothetical protein